MADDFGGGTATLTAPADTGMEITTVDNSSTDLATTGAESNGQDLATVDSTDGTTTDGQLATQPKNISEWLGKYKTEAPQLYNRASQAIGVQNRLTKEFGPKPFDTLRSMSTIASTVEKLGGITTIQAALEDIANMDRLYMDGDPRLVEEMTSTPLGKLAMPKLLGPVLKKVAALDPHAYTSAILPAFQDLASVDKNAWASYVAGVFLNHLQRNNVDVIVRNMASLIPADNQNGAQLAAQFDKFVKDLEGWAALQPAERPKPVEADPRFAELEKTRKELEEKNLQMENAQWKAEADGFYNSMIGSEYDKLTRGRTVTPDQKDLIRLAIKGYWNGSIKGRIAIINSQVESRDKVGYLKDTRGVLQENAEKWVRRAVNSVLGAKPGQVATTPKFEGTVAQPAQNGKGFQKGPVPKAEEINMFDPRTNIRNRQAVLKTGALRAW